ncbi:uncharacterized protein PSFLO_01271 [Pseudozyma flocculosa]|uniref:Uncharacterized protein n=1 Tax=Pseudozyma flocculosa TaxID=84751 RepID=A0A5C3EVC6_9BASI|nr:uncharacterized protein PSFLO_01271 [Pseudozyma flocculosa]
MCGSISCHSGKAQCVRTKGRRVRHVEKGARWLLCQAGGGAGDPAWCTSEVRRRRCMCSPGRSLDLRRDRPGWVGQATVATPSPPRSGPARSFVCVTEDTRHRPSLAAEARPSQARSILACRLGSSSGRWLATRSTIDQLLALAPEAGGEGGSPVSL